MDVKSLYTKALKLSKQGEYSKAIREFDKILGQQPYYADALSDRGVAKYHVNDYDGALDDLNVALKLEPHNPYRYASRAYIRDRAGDTQGAIEDYRKAIELEPENAVSQNNLGLLEEKLGYMERSKKRYKLADKLSEDVNQGDVISTKERDEIVDQLLTELNIEVGKKEEAPNSVIFQMISVFKSKTERKDFLLFLQKLLRIKKD